MLKQFTNRKYYLSLKNHVVEFKLTNGEIVKGFVQEYALEIDYDTDGYEVYLPKQHLYQTIPEDWSWNDVKVVFLEDIADLKIIE